ncbi:MAG: hypothetical protein H6673_08075 [Anaerolineales bacterium]|nr:hypothetical protein [Anaerolineales bacterium]
MINQVLQWLISIVLALEGGFGYRLLRVEQLGGPVRAVVLDGIDSLNAEGDSLVRVPLLGADAYQVTERFTLPYGPILDLYRTEQAIYALTNSHLIILSPDGRQVVEVLAGGGERLTVSPDRLVVSSHEAGVRAYPILVDGSLGQGLLIPTPTDTQQTALVDNSLLALADHSAGLRLIRLTGTGAQVSSSLSEVSPSTGVANFSHWLYVSSQHRLYIVDTAITPRVVGYYAPLHDTQGLAWWDGWLLVADGADGLKVYNTEPFIQYRNSQLNTPTYHVAVNDKAIVTTHPNGLSIFGVGSLPDVTMQRFVPLWDTPRGLSLNGQSALVALGVGGLGIVDIASGHVRNSLTFPNSSVQHAIAHPDYPNLLYLALEDGRLVTLYSDQKSVITSDLPVAGTPTYLAIQDDTLALASGRAGLQFFSLNPDPTQPQLIDTLPPHDLATSGITYVQASAQQRWLMRDGNGMQWVQLDQRTLRILTTQPDIEGHTLITPNGQLLVAKDNQLDSYRNIGDQFIEESHYRAPLAYTDLQARLGQVVAATENAGIVVLDVQHAALPREQRWIDIAAQRLTIQGDDWIVLQTGGGWVHLRFPLLLADRPAVEPVVVGQYQPTLGTRRLLPIFAKAALDGVRLNNVDILLDANGVPYRPDSQVSNPDVVGIALASDGYQVWLIGHSGQLWQLDPQTLAVIPPTLDLAIPASSMTSHAGLLWVGTRTGELWQVSLNGQLQQVRNDLGGAVLQIKALDDGTWLVSADRGGLWWLSSDFATLAHTPTSAFAADVDTTGQWVAVATGACGLHVFDRALNLQAYLHAEVVTDVRFEGGDILAATNGIPTRYAFNPDRPPLPPPQPHRLNDIAWEPTPCLDLRYEVWIDDVLMGTTEQTTWQPPQGRDYRWQVVAIDTLGNRSRSPEWTAYAPITNWIGAPPPLLTTLAPPSDKRPTPPWWALGLVLVMLGLSGLWTLIRRR